jgi:prepilin signal peptidase PulO-like enzyme (type II secretory pathway)
MLESILIISLLGLSLGSFINVCAYRLPRVISVLTLRSFCPSCNHRLSWYELTPLFGYALNRGRCQYCKERISPSYPLVELISAGILVILFLKYSITIEFVLSSIFCLLMVLIAIIDWKHFIIPNQIVIVGFVFGLAIKALINTDVLAYAIISSVGSMVTVAIILYLSNIFFKKETMGWGDVKLAGVIGLFLGFQNFLIVFWLAALSGSIYGIWLLRKRGMPRETKLPFGSFLAAAACVVLYFQESISELIRSWLTYAQ